MPNHDFPWTHFYEAVADGLLQYRDRRDELIEEIHAIASRVQGLSNLQDQFQDGSTGPLKDICPFTAMGIFNRGITNVNRKNIATQLALFLGVEKVAPDSFEGIPVLNNQNSWFFAFERTRNPGDIDALWEIFARAIALSNDAAVRADFIAAYNNATPIAYVGWNLTMGLYWIRPWHFPTLDGRSRPYIEDQLHIQIGRNGPGRRCNAKDYLAVLDTLKTRFQEEACPVHSFPELCLAAWRFREGKPSVPLNVTDTDVQRDEPNRGPEEEVPIAPIEPYSVDNIISEGCFIEQLELERILERLQTKKNLILQGPPGTGKTWLAKRLAFALIGQRNDRRVRPVQFHPNLSYEDFVRGWRPSGEGRLTLVNGPFMEMIGAAREIPGTGHVIVIEEINRGNPAQIFGEMLTLLEADKRTQNEALELAYHREDDERVFIPENLYVIGTMNIADRSLALVDLALRRRFAFIDLKPTFGEAWKEWVQTQCGIAMEILDEIENRILSLNTEITSDPSLGRQFSIGHSYVTPPLGIPINDAQEWFRQVVDTEIGPLLDEYWFDSPDRARKAREQLLEGF